jgi:hypothetical protein
MHRVRVSDDNASFVLENTRRPFTPYGFNYDHDETGRLLEDYWLDHWPKVEQDFREMKTLTANVVRIHLQFAKFMTAPDRPNEQALAQLRRLLDLAEKTNLYLDITGLACYHKQDVPPWYDKLSTPDRWAAQANFWSAVAQRCADSPAVFCYDLMNEPVVGGKNIRDDWLGPPFAGKHFVQFITLHTPDQPRHEVARQWIQTLTPAIREHDPTRLITVGLVPWSLDRPGLQSGFIPDKIAPDLDFIALHLYPEAGKLPQAIQTLKAFNAGKPVVIEETFPLKCTPADFETFLTQARPHAAGLIGFYWGKTPDQYQNQKSIPESLTLAWLNLFQRHVNTWSPTNRN